MSTTDNPFRGTAKERVRCLGCHETFESLRAYHVHKANAVHGDKGEAYL